MADKAGMHGDEALQFGEPGAGERTSVAELPAPPGLDFGEVDSALQRVVGAYSAGFGSIFKGLCAELNQQKSQLRVLEASMGDKVEGITQQVAERLGSVSSSTIEHQAEAISRLERENSSLKQQVADLSGFVRNLAHNVQGTALPDSTAFRHEAPAVVSRSVAAVAASGGPAAPVSAPGGGSGGEAAVAKEEVEEGGKAEAKEEKDGEEKGEEGKEEGGGEKRKEEEERESAQVAAPAAAKPKKRAPRVPQATQDPSTMTPRDRARHYWRRALVFAMSSARFHGGRVHCLTGRVPRALALSERLARLEQSVYDLSAREPPAPLPDPLAGGGGADATRQVASVMEKLEAAKRELGIRVSRVEKSVGEMKGTQQEMTSALVSPDDVDAAVAEAKRELEEAVAAARAKAESAAREALAARSEVSSKAEQDEVTTKEALEELRQSVQESMMRTITTHQQTVSTQLQALQEGQPVESAPPPPPPPPPLTETKAGRRLLQSVEVLGAQLHALLTQEGPPLVSSLAGVGGVPRSERPSSKSGSGDGGDAGSDEEEKGGEGEAEEAREARESAGAARASLAAMARSAEQMVAALARRPGRQLRGMEDEKGAAESTDGADATWVGGDVAPGEEKAQDDAALREAALALSRSIEEAMEALPKHLWASDPALMVDVAGQAKGPGAEKQSGGGAQGEGQDQSAAGRVSLGDMARLLRVLVANRTPPPSGEEPPPPPPPPPPEPTVIREEWSRSEEMVERMSALEETMATVRERQDAVGANVARRVDDLALAVVEREEAAQRESKALAVAQESLAAVGQKVEGLADRTTSAEAGLKSLRPAVEHAHESLSKVQQRVHKMSRAVERAEASPVEPTPAPAPAGMDPSEKRRLFAAVGEKVDRAYFDSWVQRVRQQVEEVDTVASKARDATLEVVGEQQVLHLIQQAEERLKGLFASREDLAEHAQLALESLGSKASRKEVHELVGMVEEEIRRVKAGLPPTETLRKLQSSLRDKINRRDLKRVVEAMAHRKPDDEEEPILGISKVYFRCLSCNQLVPVQPRPGASRGSGRAHPESLFARTDELTRPMQSRGQRPESVEAGHQSLPPVRTAGSPARGGGSALAMRPVRGSFGAGPVVPNSAAFHAYQEAMRAKYQEGEARREASGWEPRPATSASGGQALRDAMPNMPVGPLAAAAPTAPPASQDTVEQAGSALIGAPGAGSLFGRSSRESASRHTAPARSAQRVHHAHTPGVPASTSIRVRQKGFGK